MPENKLIFGDNINVLRNRDRLPSDSVDLIYLDPPFNSKRDYNTFFKERDGSRSAAMIKAFKDTWTWNVESAASFEDVVQNGPAEVSQAMIALAKLMPNSDMLAYLSMMAPRLVELKRVLKPNGTLYLHCDPTASHYLKVLLDSLFGPTRFLNEITWKRTTSHGNVKRNYGKVADILLVYTKGDRYTWNQQYTDFTEKYIKKKFIYKDSDGRIWQSVTLRNPGPRPNLRFPYQASNGVTYQPHPNGWSCDLERLTQYDRENRLHFPSKPNGKLRLKMYLDESKGIRIQNLWLDIPAINSQAAEQLGYPTQKPLALLERIIKTSSNAGDTILDPFCGCGTAIAAAHGLNRNWIGIDITHLAVSLIKFRLHNAYGAEPGRDYEVGGEPEDYQGAVALAESDRHKFQAWAVGKLTAQPITEAKKGKDKGIDGRFLFNDGSPGDPHKEVIISVKSGKPKVADLRDLNGTVTREGAVMGAIITLNRPTRDMEEEAANAGFYASPWGGGKSYPRLQLITVEDLLRGKRIDCPPWSQITSFKAAPKAKRKADDRPDHRRLRRSARDKERTLMDLFGADPDGEGDPIDTPEPPAMG